tara:strand:+ start:14234 stop:14932 length:699 start_codon:yes stop_codon:yes gene_type:complete
MKTIVIGTTYADFSYDRSRQSQQSVALEVMTGLPKNVFPVAVTYRTDPEYEELKNFNIPQLRLLERNSRDLIRNVRPLPYIYDIFNVLSCIKCNVFGFVNSDILIKPDVCDILQKNLDTFILQRSDVGETTVNQFNSGLQKVIPGGDDYVGADGFFFNKLWWHRNKSLFPKDLILGETEWDTCYRAIMAKGHNSIEARCLYHVYHNQVWDYSSAGARNNIAIWEWLKQNKMV